MRAIAQRCVVALFCTTDIMINDTKNKQIGNDDFKKEGTSLSAKGEAATEQPRPKAMKRFFFPIEGVTIEAESLIEAQKKIAENYKNNKSNK